MFVTSMFVQDADVSFLWSLDVLGITDPIEQMSRNKRDELTRDFLIRTAKLKPSGRYEVKLP